MSENNDLSFIRLMIKGLSIITIKDKEITLEEHKSLLIFLKNHLIQNLRYINNSDILDIFKSIFNLILTISPNENLQCDSMTSLFINLVKTICDNNNSMMEKSEYIEELLQFIFNKINNCMQNDFIYIGKNGIDLISCILCSKYVGQKNYLENIERYLVPTADIIFSKVNLYIIPNNNIYNEDFIDILIKLYDTFYSALNKLKRFYSSLRRREISEEIFKKYGQFTYELIQLVPLIDEETKNNYGDANPILIFGEEFQELNNMKSKAFKFMTLIIQYLTITSNNNESQDKNN